MALTPPPLAVPRRDDRDCGDFGVPVDSPDPEKEELSRGLVEEDERTVGLAGDILQLQADVPSWQVRFRSSS